MKFPVVKLSEKQRSLLTGFAIIAILAVVAAVCMACCSTPTQTSPIVSHTESVNVPAASQSQSGVSAPTSEPSVQPTGVNDGPYLGESPEAKRIAAEMVAQQTNPPEPASPAQTAFEEEAERVGRMRANLELRKAETGGDPIALGRLRNEERVVLMAEANLQTKIDLVEWQAMAQRTLQAAAANRTEAGRALGLPQIPTGTGIEQPQTFPRSQGEVENRVLGLERRTGNLEYASRKILEDQHLTGAALGSMVTKFGDQMLKISLEVNQLKADVDSLKQGGIGQVVSTSSASIKERTKQIRESLRSLVEKESANRDAGANSLRESAVSIEKMLDDLEAATTGTESPPKK